MRLRTVEAVARSVIVIYKSHSYVVFPADDHINYAARFRTVECLNIFLCVISRTNIMNSIVRWIASIDDKFTNRHGRAKHFRKIIELLLVVGLFVIRNYNF